MFKLTPYDGIKRYYTIWKLNHVLELKDIIYDVEVEVRDEQCFEVCGIVLELKDITQYNDEVDVIC
jgi:hypothetical protein